MKKMKKLLAMLLAVVMVMGMSLTAFATENQEPSTPAGEEEVQENNDDDNSGVTGNQTSGGVPSDYTKAPIKGDFPAPNDDTTVKITNLTGITDSTKVSLYKIASPVYYSDGRKGLDTYEFVEGTATLAEAQSGLSAAKITEIANGLKASPQTISVTPDETTLSGGATEFSKVVTAGVYIAIITGANDAIYNPILLTATYDGDGQLVGGTIAANSDYLYGATAVAKSSTPTIEKTVSGGTPDDEINANGDETVERGISASLGTKLDYTLTPTMPEYPSNAVNKALFVSDTMSEGLTFLPDTLVVTVNNEAYKVFATSTENGKQVGWLLKAETDFQTDSIGKVAITPATEGQGAAFVINFKYEKLVVGNDGSVYVPVVTYSALINDKAVLKNGNTATLTYSTEPNTTHDWDENTVTPPSGNEYKEKSDEETVYTYELRFHKIGVGNDADKLPGAIFGIYSDAACTKLVDVVKTDANGEAITTQVAAGRYYIKEIEAPKGYTLNETVYTAEANWTTATTYVTTTKTIREYTSNQSEAISSTQVGWLSNDNKFYEFSTTPTTGLTAAYLKNETTLTTKTESIVANTNAEGMVTTIKEVNLDGSVKEGAITSIPNTKLSFLPSTGGIGTTIFTVGGCIIMIVAAGLFFASRKKSEK